MNSFLLLLLEISCVFSIQYLFFLLLLRRLSFHGINRAVLMSMLIFSIIIPLLQIHQLPEIWGKYLVPEFSAGITISSENSNPVPESAFPPVSVGSIVLFIYFSGLAVFLYRLVLSVVKLFLLIKKARPALHDKYVYTAPLPAAFSCFNFIFIPHGTNECKREMIIKHEKAHTFYFHTIDLILTELFMAFLWFHPLVYFFRKSIRAVHEYQVDSFLVKHFENHFAYLKLMLNYLDMYHQPVGFYNYFNGLTLKKRITMITKTKSSKSHKFKYLLFLPLVAILIMSFANYAHDKPDYFPLKKGSYGKITSTHGEVFKNPITQKVVTHKGLDLKAPEGTEVFASGRGKVVKTANEKGWGNLLVIDHGNGYETWYAHLQKFNVSEGDDISRGQLVANVGNTGYSTGPHLHFEVRYNGESMDPFDFMEQ